MKDSCLEIKLKNGRIEIVDYLKGFSILTIVLMHYIQRIKYLPAIVLKGASVGGSGVHIFFFCSGLGLYLSYLNHKTNFKEFITKRFSKIYFPYIIIVLISFLCPYMYSGEDRVLALLSHIFLFKMFVPKYDTSFVYPFWFMLTIIQFYFIFIPLCKINTKFKKRKNFFVAMLAVSVVWWIVCYATKTTEVRVISSAMFQYLWEFALGMCVAESLKQGNSINLKLIYLFIFSVVGLGLQAVMMIKPELKVFNDIPAFLGYGSLAILIFNLVPIRKMCMCISKFSYELYLVHTLVIDTIFYFVKSSNTITSLILVLVAFLISLVLSYFYSILIRNIFSKFKK